MAKKQKKLPDFIIVGTMKSGTSSLSFHLGNHPDICISQKHEIHFFDREYRYQQGYEWYKERLSEDMTHPDQLVGEKTPTYSYLDYVAERIHRMNPDIKLIWIFRNPIDRSYSNYLHRLKKGGELLSFEKAVAREESRMETDYFLGYLHRSVYYRQVENYLKYFKKSQMHFMLFEDLLKNPVGEVTAVLEFLGADPAKLVFEDEIRNSTFIPRWPVTLGVAETLFGKRSMAYRLTRKLNLYKKKPGYKKLTPEMREKLIPYFEEPNRRLSEIIGKDLSCWNR